MSTTAKTTANVMAIRILPACAALAEHSRAREGAGWITIACWTNAASFMTFAEASSRLVRVCGANPNSCEVA
jgi:hypothetical protein